MAILNQRPHVPEEECKDQRHNVAAINISIAHDDYFMVPELFNVQNTLAIFLFNAHAKGSKHVLDLLVVIDLMLKRFFNVKDLSTKRKNRLEIPVTSLFSCATCTISLYKIDLALMRIS